MRIVTDGKAVFERSVLALGMFDGVHIGHRVLLERAKVLAKRSNVPLVACTFTEHPLSLVAPDHCPPMLTTLQERAALLEEAGVDLLFAQPFTEEMRQMPPEVYVGELMRRFHPVDVVCGYNHTFGKGGAGTSAFLAALGDALGFRTQVVPQVTLEGAEVSSSAIRNALKAGQASQAAMLLGRPYQLTAQLLPRENGAYKLYFAQDGKQQLAVKTYRCLMQMENGKRFPCAVKCHSDGSAALQLPIAVPEQRITLSVLA